MKIAHLLGRLKHGGWRKLLSFHLIAWVGTLVNLAVLWLTHGVLKIPLLIAGAIAIEIAIIHNFTGHYFITWKDRVKRTPRNYLLLLLKYNLVTASIDFVVNLGILWLLTHFLGVHYLIANIAGQVLGPLFKLVANEFLVFPKLKKTKLKLSEDNKEIEEKA
ncbi:MAG: GtrA family protein [Candidatus Cloacimonetes bacterium]|nr:GtrA family protein [Candidatus Cloacimonadota bacterium]